MKYLIVLLLCFGVCGYVWGDTYYQNGWIMYHSDILKDPEMYKDQVNIYNYPSDDKYHIMICLGCGCLYYFYSFPISTAYIQCPNSQETWGGYWFEHPKENKMIEIHQADTFDNMHKWLKTFKNNIALWEFEKEKYKEVK